LLEFFCSIIVAVTIAILMGIMKYLPKVVLGCILIVAVLSLVDIEQIKFLWRVNKQELALFTLTFIVTLAVGPELGLFISIGFSLLLIIYRSARPHTSILGRMPGTVAYHEVSRFENAVTISGIIVFRYDFPIYFMNVKFFKRKLLEILAILERNNKLHALILDCGCITDIDSTGLTAIRDIIQVYNSRGITICFATLTAKAYKALYDAEIVQELGENHFFYRIHDAVKALVNNKLDVHRPEYHIKLEDENENSLMSQFLNLFRGQRKISREKEPLWRKNKFYVLV